MSEHCHCLKKATHMTRLNTSNTTDILVRVILIAGLWWVITEGRADAWLVGLPAVALATLASASLSAHASPRVLLVGLLGFVFLIGRLWTVCFLTINWTARQTMYICSKVGQQRSSLPVPGNGRRILLLSWVLAVKPGDFVSPVEQ
jgi:hypothetical protein